MIYQNNRMWYTSGVNFNVFFFNDTATTEIYTLSLHDALPICPGAGREGIDGGAGVDVVQRGAGQGDRKSTRLNSSHLVMSYAVFCLKKQRALALRLHGTQHP